MKGLPRGIAFRLIEAGGLIDRREVERDLHVLSQVERRTLRSFAVRVGVHSVWLPGLQKPRGRLFAQAFVENGAAVTAQASSPRRLSAHGLRLVAGRLIPIETLERMAELRAGNDGRLSPEALVELGWSADEARAVIAALKTVRADRPDKPGRAAPPPKDTPFAALAALRPQAERARRKPRRRKAGPGAS